MNEIMVSVVMIAYNHERYIRKALESVVNQKTNFKFEIIIHDDASPDKTADIIREYEKNIQKRLLLYTRKKINILREKIL